MQNKRCFNCVHYRGKLECNAFTGGIPEEILLGEDKHIKKHKLNTKDKKAVDFEVWLGCSPTCFKEKEHNG